MRVLIVEDDFVVAGNIKSILADISSQIKVLEITGSVTEAVKWVKNNSLPDLVFIDIHLPDGSALHFFDQIMINIPVVFITSIDKKVFEVLKVNCINYILKPVKELDVRVALDRVINKVLPNCSDTEKKLQTTNTQPLKNLLIIAGNKLIPLALDKISFFYTQKEKVMAFTNTGEFFIVDKSLDSLMELLPGNRFFRANRQFIISSKSLKEIVFWFGNRLKVNIEIEAPGEIIISKNRVSVFKMWLQECSI